MTTFINASTSSGLVVNSDNSGVIALQSNGATQATLTNAGFAYPGATVQVVNSILTTTMTWTGTSAIQNILAASITPKFATSKILVQCHVQIAAQHAFQNIISLTMDRSGTKIAANTSGGASGAQSAWGCYGGPSYADSGRIQEFFSLNYLDSPSTTSALTYTLGGRLDNSAGNAYVGRWSLNNDSANVTTLTLMEIAQ